MEVSFEDFKKLELRVAEIESVIPHPNADRLYVVGVKVGDLKKTLVAGIRNFYSEQELIGKKVIVVNNLAPVILRGVESQGMILAASEGELLSVIVPDRPIPTGAVVK